MMDEAAAARIKELEDMCERLKTECASLVVGISNLTKDYGNLMAKYAESERQRAKLSEYIETLAKGGIEAATGAGK